MLIVGFLLAGSAHVRPRAAWRHSNSFRECECITIRVARTGFHDDAGTFLAGTLDGKEHPLAQRRSGDTTQGISRANVLAIVCGVHKGG
ncbi:MAG TPA: hypothetical protein VJ698_12000 [Noviherbaspirillum sp.]|nr:hypothetical protein [Noviherbaspirillum sp.]